MRVTFLALILLQTLGVESLPAIAGQQGIREASTDKIRYHTSIGRSSLPIEELDLQDNVVVLAWRERAIRRTVLNQEHACSPHLINLTPVAANFAAQYCPTLGPPIR